MDVIPSKTGFGTLSDVAPDHLPGARLSGKWAALHEAADVVGALAGLTEEAAAPEVRDFPVAVREAEGWRRALAEQGMEDLTAIMEPGLSALLAVRARGADGRAAAQALWREFQAARDSLLTLIPPR